MLDLDLVNQDDGIALNHAHAHEGNHTEQDHKPKGPTQYRRTVRQELDATTHLGLTYDQGREMAEHAHLSRQTGMQMFFAHPHSPRERGINENTNGLLRVYLPKGSDLSIHSQAQLDAIAFKLNARPRKSLGWT